MLCQVIDGTKTVNAFWNLVACAIYVRIENDLTNSLRNLFLLISLILVGLRNGRKRFFAIKMKGKSNKVFYIKKLEVVKITLSEKDYFFQIDSNLFSKI